MREPLFRTRRPEDFRFWFVLYLLMKSLAVVVTLLEPVTVMSDYGTVPPFPGYLPHVLFFHGISFFLFELPFMGALYFHYKPTPESIQFKQAFARYRLPFYAGLAVLLVAGVLLFLKMMNSDAVQGFLMTEGRTQVVVLCVAVLMILGLYSPLLLVGILRLRRIRQEPRQEARR